MEYFLIILGIVIVGAAIHNVFALPKEIEVDEIETLNNYIKQLEHRRTILNGRLESLDKYDLFEFKENDLVFVMNSLYKIVGFKESKIVYKIKPYSYKSSTQIEGLQSVYLVKNISESGLSATYPLKISPKDFPRKVGKMPSGLTKTQLNKLLKEAKND